MAKARIRTLDFLPEIFQTPTNAQFLTATLDQLVNPPITEKIEGYIGSKVGYGINAKDFYVKEYNKTRTDYQLDPGVVFTKKNESIAQDFISYPGLLDALKLKGGVTNNNNRLFESQFYSWDSFTNLDKIINFNEYYWLPDGPPTVTVAAERIFANNDFIVTDLSNGYNIRTLGSSGGSTNPTITLLRGGSYRFLVNQDSQFWIQTEPGVSGYSLIETNVYLRDVFGVSNNGAEVGTVEFNVPQKNAQDEYNYPGNNVVDLVSTQTYAEINGQRLVDLKNIDGVTSLDGLTIMFYNTGDLNEVGYTQEFFDENFYDVNGNLVLPKTITVTNTNVSGAITCDSTTDLVEGQTITFDGLGFGGITSYSATSQIYYVKTVLNGTQFTISTQLNGTEVPLTTATGTMIGNINQGLYEEGFYEVVSNFFYKIEYVGNPDNPVLKLVPFNLIPSLEKITVQFGAEFINKKFYKNILGVISLMPNITAPLDTLYYQDGTSANKVGVIKLIESNITNTINVETDILGKTNYTSPNGVVFTNGLKISFDGDVIPSRYLQGEYYVEGVGTAIELIPVSDLFCPEPFTEAFYIPYDSLPYDIGNYESNLYVPVLQDYITIARNSINKNAWSRSNRWFHLDVIRAAANYNNNPQLVTALATKESKAKRPIIEFYPNLALFDFGVVGKKAVDFIDFRATDALSTVAGQVSYYPDVETYTSYTATLNGVTNDNSTTATISNINIVGSFQVGQYITDTRLSNTDITYPTVLPADAQISNIVTTSTTTTLTISWQQNITFSTMNNVSFVANDQQNDSFKVFDGARIIFAIDSNVDVKNKIYQVNISQTETDLLPVITLTETPDALCLPNDTTVIIRGYNNLGKTYYFNGIDWLESQQKIYVNQPPLFDILDSNNISFGNEEIYQGTTFKGCKLFAYGIGSGKDDPVLSFPLRYSNINNLGDISFDVSLNLDTFDYVSNNEPITQKVNTGYVFNYVSREDAIRELGWQTAVGPSVQYQIFTFDYYFETPQFSFVCDVAMLDQNKIEWPTVQVFINNVLQPKENYSVSVGEKSTTVTLNTLINFDTVVQILLLSNQVSQTAYYQIPTNLNNNPLNQELTVANLGDVRTQYQSIFANHPNTSGLVFGSNNYRDLGNVVRYGNKIIQNSASLVLPGAFLRKSNHNLFDALLFNSREYVKFKTLLVNTVANGNYTQQFNPAFILDDALDQISSSKSQTQAFFWSDMLPNKAPYITKTYTFNNTLSTSLYPLSRVYDFTSANYYGVLVYLSRIITGTVVTKQLVKGVDYTIDSNGQSIKVNLPLQPADKITIKEYNQTYGSYVPNTPTKLGLYPAFIPAVILDSNYFQPTYFILGHDGSYNKLYGQYDPVLETLIDFRDQALLEFETRIYNNLKLSTPVPIQSYEVVPGFFRDNQYSYKEFLEIYSESFLNWVGQNRLDYQKQFYNASNEFTYNYSDSQNRLNKSIVEQGYWRGLYQYLYDTTTPNITPWEMLGFSNQPNWWEDRYGTAPYTKDNLILWQDLEIGYNYNNGEPYIMVELARPGLSEIIPVDSVGNLLPPFISVIGNYDSNIFQRDWKVGDDGPVELSYRRSSTWPFDLMRIMALTKSAKFFNLGVDLDNYKYNEEFNQYLINDRSHLVISNIEIYGNGTPKTSYINWIVDYEKQLGINATDNIKELLQNLDVRLIYRLAGFSDKTLLKFYVEKGTPNSNNASLLIPDESFSILLYDNQPFDNIAYSSVIVQLTDDGNFSVFGNSQNFTYFKILNPIYDGYYDYIKVEKTEVKVTQHYGKTETLVPYGTKFHTLQEVSQFLTSYGAYLKSKGCLFDQIEFGLEINWTQMVSEFLYWAQTGWEKGSVITLNPAASMLKIDRENSIVEPLTITQSNFLLNQNLFPIKLNDISIIRDGTYFSAAPLNQGDAIAYGQFNLNNIEHGIVFDNVTVFNDQIYNLVTGLRQNRIYVRGTKTAEWNGTVNAYGFILNQDNITEWAKDIKYTKGQIVKFKNKFWTALKIIQPSLTFNENDWKETDYDEIQKGLLPNSSTRSYESTIYYNCNEANLEQDADLLSFSLIGYRPRDYLALVDLTDITQINVYKNLIKNKGTKNAVDAFRGANLPQGGIDYEVYENWAIKSGEFGGVLNQNFVEFRLNQTKLTGNPATVSLINGYTVGPVQQNVPIYNLYNYGRPINNVEILSTISPATPADTYQDAGYVNFEDVYMSSYFFRDMKKAVNQNGKIISINNFYVGDFAYIANYLEKWQVFSFIQNNIVLQVTQTTNNRSTVLFLNPHNLERYQPVAIINFDPSINGYYYVADIISNNEIAINLTFNNPPSPVSGYGILLVLQSHRVSSPNQIPGLPLINNEFTKNTVWVDEAGNGSWAVYRKSINYKYAKEFIKPLSAKFGSAVAYSNKFKYLISDSVLGTLYRYDINPVVNQWNIIQEVSGDASFGSSIAIADDLLFVSEPTSSTPALYTYVSNNTILQDEFIPFQTPIGPPSVDITNWGSSIAVSGDKNWLYVSDINNNRVHVYRKQNNLLQVTDLQANNTYTIASVGEGTDWESIGAIQGKEGISFIATGPGTGTGTVIESGYAYATVIHGFNLVRGNNFGYKISTNYNGDILVVSAPNISYSATINNWGKAFIYQRGVQNFESQFTVPANSNTVFTLAYNIPTLVVEVTQTNSGDSSLTCADTSQLVTNTPVMFTGNFGISGLQAYKVYYIGSIISSTKFTIKSSRSSGNVAVTTATGLTMNGYCQINPLFVFDNGSAVEDSNYAIINNSLHYNGPITAGDIITVSTNNFVLAQSVNSNSTLTTGIQFGSGLDVNNQGTEILVGAPFEVSSQVQEGAVYRFTNGGASYGIVIGTQQCNITTPRTLLINGYMVSLPIGNAQVVSETINAFNVTNIKASYTTDNRLLIQVIDDNLTVINKKLVLGIADSSTLPELGLQLYTNTQIIRCPHVVGATEFGRTIKFNEFNSVVISAPVGTRYLGTQFDFNDDANLHNDTVFDNNATQFIDDSPAAGAVYMFDYIPANNERLDNPGSYVYAQSLNNFNLIYGFNPRYGTALDFNENKVIIGTPNFLPDDIDGQVILYMNKESKQDWNIFRESAPIVDINRLDNIQLISAFNNNTLTNLDYFDPLQGKLLGAVRQNIDFVSNTDPAVYSNQIIGQLPVGLTWGVKQEGRIWFDTSNVKFVNYHQKDEIEYNARYWGTVFPGSDVAVYTWIVSNVTPSVYIAEARPGTPLNNEFYTTENVINSAGVIAQVYCFWVRNSNIIFKKLGKTLSDKIIESYILNPKNTGINYFAPISPNVFGLYNISEYLNGVDTLLHIGYSTGTNDDPAHNEFTLIRANYADDFLPGLPSDRDIPGYYQLNVKPESLYDRLLDSLSGVDEEGEVVPNPWLPKAVQSGVLARPRQSFFYDRLEGLKNYLIYANEILLQYPIAEIRREASFLFATGEFFNTPDYWEYVNWWATGYNNNTKSVLQVPLYADLSTLDLSVNSIVTVAENGDGKFEVYRYDGNNLWTRIGLQNGTIQFKVYLWDYAAGKLGFGDNFYDTSVYDLYPSEETRYIVRALNEQIYTNELQIYRNKSLILLFEYIQSETIESQNYIPWLNKTSLVDVSHKIRELRPIEVFQTDNQEFLEGYINEVKPYHVVIKEFIFKYTGEEINVIDPTDFDLPATYDNSLQQFISPQLVYKPSGEGQYLPTDPIWQTKYYSQWFLNKGVSISGGGEIEITTLASYLTLRTSFMLVNNAQGFPINGVIRIGKELISYSNVDRSLNLLGGLTRGFNNTEIVDHIPGEIIFIDLPDVVVLNGGRGYTEPPKVIAYINPENTATGTFTGYIDGNKLTVTNVEIGEIIIGNYIHNQNVIYGTQIIAQNSDGTYELNIAQTLSIQNFIEYVGPSRPAILEAVMSLDQVLSINVIDPGQGYMMTPEILVDPSTRVIFTSNDVVLESNTIRIYAPILQTGDVVRYQKGEQGSNIGGLVDGQWYYINLLQTNPTTIIALYSSYGDAINDNNRIDLYSDGTGNDHILNLGAKATAITSSSPVRENNIKLRFDRTTYTSQIIDWEAGQYYGSFFAGSYSNSEKISSSSIQLQSTEPPISDVLASAQGVAFEIAEVNNDRELVWSEFPRIINSTVFGTNSIIITPYDNTIDENSSGSTIGFYIGMPVKFAGTIPTPITVDTVYYVHSIISTVEFTISTSQFGPQLTGFNTIVPANPGATMFAAKIIDTAVLTVNYPGILKVTQTQTQTNILTVPVSEIGTGGTNGFYIGLPVFFTEGGFGGIIENLTYYVSTIIDNQHFIISENSAPTIATVLATTVTTNYVTLNSTNNFQQGDPVIFTGDTFGGIIAGTLYYVRNIINSTQLTLSTVDNNIVVLTTDVGSCDITNQKDAVKLTTSSGNMVMNVSLPVSPGQVDGQLFTLYQTSQQYPDISTGTIGNLITRDLKATLSSDKVAITSFSGGTTNFYTNLPVQFTTPPAGSGLSAGVTYYVVEYTGLQIPDILNPGEFITLPGLQTSVSSTDGSFNNLVCDSTNDLYLNMPIIFSGQSLGNVVLGEEYYVRYFITTASNFTNGEVYTIEFPGTTDFTLIGAANNNANTTFTASFVGSDPTTGTGSAYGEYPMPNGTRFKISQSLGGPIKDVDQANGLMIGTGVPYITVSTSPGGSVETLSYAKSDFGLVQFPSSSELIPQPPIFDVSYILGGYRVIISDAGLGFAVDNTITINGSLLGGTTPANNLVLTVNAVDEDGAITELICTGTPAGNKNNYYLKVISLNQFEVYSDALMQVPVSGLTLPYVGFTSTSVTGTGASNTIIVTNTSQFSVNDAVVFTGNDLPNELVLGQTYYILTIPSSTTITLANNPAGAVITIASAQTVNCTMAKPGSFALLPEPFYFNQSVVKFNNRVYVCVISNNDTEFIFGKWELVDSGDRRLNALDRVIGYYQPTVNMPGVDLTQLFSGVTYPNITYLGNPFEPGQQFELDTILQGDKFYPTDINIQAIVHDGENYLAVANAPTYSLVLGSDLGSDWSMAKLSNVPIGITDILYAGGFYTATSTNSATPIIKSSNGVVWTTVAYLAPDLEPLNSVALSLNTIIYHNSRWIAVGKNIITSENDYVWTERYNFNSTLYNELFGVTYCELEVGGEQTFTGYIAVGKAQEYEGSQLVNVNLVLLSVNGFTWTRIPSFNSNGFNSIATNNEIAVAVGENGLIYYTNDSTNWYGINQTNVISVNAGETFPGSGVTFNILNISPIADLMVDDEVRFSESFDVLIANTSYFISNVISTTQVQLKDSLGSTIILSGASGIPNQTYMFKYPQPATLNKIVFENNTFMAVGNEGRIITSIDGIVWSERNSNTVENLNGIVFANSTWTVVGNNNVIIKSADNGITWENTSNLLIAPNVYEIEGAPFSYGYGPEELVPGNITDNLMMIVNTRPGTNWPVTEYAHTGYNVVSYEISPSSAFQTTYSWLGDVLIPAQLSVFIINGTTGLSTSIYKDVDYTIDWINRTIILNTPLTFSPVADRLRIDVYEVGNGDQLIKSNSEIDPIRINTNTGFNEIYLNCNYSDNITNGSGAIRPGTNPVEVTATETIASSNIIIVDSIVDLVPNTPVVFQGLTFGNIVEDTVYYIKSVSVFDSAITVSASFNTITGIAGPTFELTDATGLMSVVINAGIGLVWTDPFVDHNGSKLVLGKTNNVIRTKASNNSITTNSTGGLIVNSPIKFSNTMFGGIIAPQTTYYIKTIIDNNEFTISTTQGGPTLVLTNATGGATFVTNDYAIAEITNSTQAKIVFAAQYNNNVDYLVYSIFGETEPSQYGYTIPETQVFAGNGSTPQFYLDNYLNDKNIYNAIVEINGIRQTFARYNIDLNTNLITFFDPPPVDSTVAVTTYNNTDRQYLNTQYGVTGQVGSNFVQIEIESTNHNEVPFDGYLVDAGSFVIGVTYTIAYLNDNDDPPGANTDFTLIGAASNTVGVTFTATGPGTGTGSAVLEGYGFDSTIVDAGDFIIGQPYTIKSVGTTDFTLIGAASNTIGVTFTATGYGTGTGTAFGPGFYDEELNWLTCASGYTTADLNVNDPIVFTSPTLDGIAPGVIYYIIEIWNLQDFVISTQVGGAPLTLTDDSGSMIATINGLSVANIININNNITSPIATTFTTATTSTLNVSAGSFVVGKSYVITNLGTTTQNDWNTIAGTTGVVYEVGDSFLCADAGLGLGTGTADLFELTVDNNNQFVVGQTIQFKGTSMGGVLTDGTVYFIYSIYTDTVPMIPVFYVTICDENQNIIPVTTDTGNMLTIVGGVPAVRITTGIPHNLATNDKVRIDGVNGSTQLNGQTFYVHRISTVQVDLYSQPYTSAVSGANYPVTDISSYAGGGYIWLDFLFEIITTNAYASDSGTNIINVKSTQDLIVNTPVIFTEIGVDIDSEIFSSSNLIAGTTYYVKELTSSIVSAGSFIVGRAYTIAALGDTNFVAIGAVSNTVGVTFIATGTGSGPGSPGQAYYKGIKVSEERNGEAVTLGNGSGVANISQWEQYNVDRLWVTVDGYRVPSSSLKLYEYNNLGILHIVEPGQEVIITSMVPSSTPDQEVFVLNVNQNQEASVYRANTSTRTWLTEPLFELDEFIYVDDIAKLTNVITQTVTTPALNVATGTYNIGLSADKNLISEVRVYNNNPSRPGYLNANSYKVIIEDLSPILSINDGLYIDENDVLTITIVEGNLIIINGEQIKFNNADLQNNRFYGLQRGANNTGIQPYFPVYSTVYSELSENKLSDIDYNKTWNSKVYNTVDGDPLQISLTTSAQFLYTDVT